VPEVDREKLDRFFATMPNQSRLAPFVNEQGCGFYVQWAERGTGFGTLTLFCDNATGEWRADTESMGPLWVGQMLLRLVGTTVVTIEELDKEAASWE
jgi:hypothetical protein